jgi:hypothetical protein
MATLSHRRDPFNKSKYLREYYMNTFQKTPANKSSLVRRKLVYGVGINDANYVTSPKVNGKQVSCIFYRTWKHMIDRCYSEKCQSTNPTYVGCAVSEQWHLFSTFKAWMEKQEWEGNQLDKDILIPENKVYSDENCIFVSNKLNSFLTDRGAARGSNLIGVHFCKRDRKYISQCNNPFTLKKERLGCFDSEIDAHNAWKKRKHELALIYADMQTDERIANALRIRFL